MLRQTAGRCNRVAWPPVLSSSVTPILTIGLPVYNAAPFLEDALRSVFAQVLSAWELIAVDDGSIDGSTEILRRLSDPRVQVLADGKHRGLGARLNQIVSLAQGNYIARMDADDLMHPERLARQIAFLEKNPEVDVVGCALISFDARQQPISVRRLPQQHSEIMADPLRGFALAHAAVMARTQWFRNHPYDESARGCEDWELWLDSRDNSRFANLAEPLYFYREPQAYSFGGYVRDKAELAAQFWKRRSSLGAPALFACAAQCARIGAYALAHVVGAEQALIRRRGSPPEGGERTLFTEALRRIHSTVLPA